MLDMVSECGINLHISVHGISLVAMIGQYTSAGGCVSQCLLPLFKGHTLKGSTQFFSNDLE